MRTRIKICGITRREDALHAVAAGADALGFVFYEPSPRCISVADAAAIAGCLPPFVTTVGLFVNAEAGFIADAVERVGLDLLQFHGQECADYCARHGRPWIRAVAMRADVDVMALRQQFSAARGLLLDAYQPGLPGGTGTCFDWSRIPAALAAQIILAGGLTPDNVGEAVRRVRPYAVDVSGGVESTRGVKDPAKVKAFIEEVRSAEQCDPIE